MKLIRYTSLILIFANLLGCSDLDPLRTGLEGKTLPSFPILLKDGNTFINTTSIDNKGPLVFLYFSPYCPYCKAEIDNIVENITSLNKIQFVLVSGYSIDEIQKISDQYKLSKYNNIIVGRDTGYKIADYFGSYRVPYTAIYDKNKKLKHSFLGKMDIGQLRKVTDFD